MENMLNSLFSTGNIAAASSIVMALIFLRYLAHKDRLLKESQADFHKHLAFSQKQFQEQLDRIADDFSGQVRRMNENIARIETTIDSIQ